MFAAEEAAALRHLFQHIFTEWVSKVINKNLLPQFMQAIYDKTSAYIRSNIYFPMFSPVSFVFVLWPSCLIDYCDHPKIFAFLEDCWNEGFTLSDIIIYLLIVQKIHAATRVITYLCRGRTCHLSSLCSYWLSLHLLRKPENDLLFSFFLCSFFSQNDRVLSFDFFLYQHSAHLSAKLMQLASCQLICNVCALFHASWVLINLFFFVKGSNAKTEVHWDRKYTA